MRILLIEDDQLIGDGLNVGLAKLGFAVDWFNDGEEGCEALFQAPYDAVILDLGLPGKDGLSILKEWRSKRRKEPVLILTAQGDVDQRVVGLESGADDYVVKPFGIKDMSLQKLYANLFGERISKAQQLTNWEADVLTDRQKQYAAIDAWACLVLYEELERLKATGDYSLVPDENRPYDL